MEFPGQMWAFLSDGIGIITGSMMGTTPLTVYIESAAGIEDGGRTGVTGAGVGALSRETAQPGSGSCGTNAGQGGWHGSRSLSLRHAANGGMPTAAALPLPLPLARAQPSQWPSCTLSPCSSHPSWHPSRPTPPAPRSCW